jgi:glycosyltransferase involved in cell wall biosynthesis
MDVSILISTKDRAQFLSRTLDSLSRVRTDSFEVELIVIDNASDETAAVTAPISFPRPSTQFCARGPRPAALNHALPIATGRYLAFTADDLRFDAFWKINLITYSQIQTRSERITNAGHQLVHSRHTMRERNQIFEWFELHKTLQTGQRIVQASPFDPMIVVEESSGVTNAHLVANGLHLKLLRQGDARLWKGEYQQAEQL